MASTTPSKPKPAPMPVDAEAIPELLKKFDRWLGWSWHWKEDAQKWDKPPLDVKTGRNGSSTDRATWCAFSPALEAYRQGRFDGLGFALGREGNLNFAGFDLDDCIEDDKIRSDAIFLARALNSYTEYSPSGNGLKVFCLGTLPSGGQRSDSQKRHFEIYDSGRYFTVTGRHFNSSPKEVLEREQELRRLYARLFPDIPPIKHRRMTEREVAISALAGLSPCRAADYESWLQVGMCLNSVSDDLLMAWDDWSQLCPDKYVSGICAAKWASFRKSGLGLGSLVHWAREDGWDYPSPNKNGNGHGYSQTNGSVARLHDPLDPHMGDGLTEENGAGPWELTIELGRPRRFLLKSPIWQEHPMLRSGQVVLTEKDILSWSSIRQKAIVQAPGVYVPPDACRPRVWDGADGRKLLRYLLHHAKTATPSTDFDRILTAAEFIVEKVRARQPLDEAKRESTKPLDMHLLEDGTLLFRIGALAELARRSRPEITFDDVREAAATYAKEVCPRIGGKRPRYHAITPQQVQAIEQAIRERAADGIESADRQTSDAELANPPF